jgi:hypothetical protein
MKTSDMPRFAELLYQLGKDYGKEISESSSENYWNTWKCFEWADVKKAVEKHLGDPDTAKFMPKPGDIVRWIVGSSETRALQAWSKVTSAISRVGSYESVIFDDLIIHSVIDVLGGWIKLCQSKTDNFPFIARDFQKHYIAFLNNPPPEFPTQLLGRMPSEQPVLIGHKKLSYEESGDVALLRVTLKNKKSQIMQGIPHDIQK